MWIDNVTGSFFLFVLIGKLKLCREERERIIRQRSSESVMSSQHRHFTSRSLSPGERLSYIMSQFFLIAC